MNQISRCMALIGFAIALAGWSAGSVAWNKGVRHEESAPKASVEDALSGIAVSMPPRDPFADYVSVPRTLADIANITDCGQIPKNLTEWVEENIETFSYLKDKKDMWPSRKFAERTFQNGLPSRAAAFLVKIMPWENYKSAIMGSNVFAATFYAAYGDFEKARTHYRAPRKMP